MINLISIASIVSSISEIVKEAGRLRDAYRLLSGKEKAPAEGKDQQTLSSLQRRMDELQDMAAEQAALTAQFIGEVEKLGRSLEGLSKRIMNCLILSLAAFATAFIALVIWAVHAF